MSESKSPSWGFVARRLGVKIMVYAETEQEAWRAFACVVNPEVAKHFELEIVQVDPRRVTLLDYAR